MFYRKSIKTQTEQHETAKNFNLIITKFTGDDKFTWLVFCCSYNIYNVLTALQRQYTENSKQISPEMKLRGLSPNPYIHVAVIDLYIPTDRSAYSAAGKYSRRIYKSLTEHESGNWD
jgi:hypothetical protein